jgi:uncharacterized membrane protein
VDDSLLLPNVDQSAADAVSRFRAADRLDRAFEVGLIVKFIDGLLEVFGGAILLLVPTAALNQLLVGLARHELADDPHDWLVTHVLPSLEHLVGSSAAVAGAYLVAHGLIKIILVGAVFADRLWAYPWMIWFLAAFIAYQSYQFVLHPTLWLAALTLFDAGMLWLTRREYARRRAN